MGTTADAVTGTISKTVEWCMYNTTTERTHLKQTTAVVGVRVNLRMVTNVVAYTTQSISEGPVRP